MHLVKSYWTYRRRAVTRHGVHSPFLYELIENVFRRRDWMLKEDISKLYNSLRKDKSVIHVQDLGAGSRKNLGNSRKVCEIAKISSGKPKQLGLLQRLATHLQCRHILELGSNLGLSTAALAASPTCSRMVSIEGAQQLAEIATRTITSLSLNATILTGSFEDELPVALRQLHRVDMAYIDGNHRKLPTLAYVHAILPYIDDNSLIVIGDIHWSPQMEEAWEEIKHNDLVTVSVDTFELGLLFFRKELSKEHFTIRY